MPRRIDIELTSALEDGGFTWRAAGAKQPKGSVEGTVLPSGAKVGDELKVEVEQTIDGIDILGVVHGRARSDRDDVLELKPAEREFKPVLETRAKGGRRGGRDGDRRGGRDGERRGKGRGRDGGKGRGNDGDRRGGRDGDARGGRDGERRGRGGPRFTPPPELPKRPKPKRLRPGKEYRNAVLAEVPEEQRPIAEIALQGMKAVRDRVKSDNAKLAADGKPTMPEASVLKMAEDLLPKLRIAEWRDRADAAKRQLDNLDLRDLRSVVASASDPSVARDDSTRELADELKAALVTKQEEELRLWFGDVDAALAVGRVIRALRLSAQPPKAGVPFPVDIAERLLQSTVASLAPGDSADRWVATLEAAAFSPVHAQVKPLVKPDEITDDLLKTVKRLGPALPLVAELFEIEVPADQAFPKPLRPDYGKRRKDKQKSGDDQRGGPKDGRKKSDDRGKSRDAKPPEEPKAKGEPKSGEDTKPEDTEAKDAAPTEDTKPQDAATPVQDTKPQDAATPVQDTKPADEPQPAEEAAPTEEGTQAEEPASSEDTATPAEDTKAEDAEKPAEEDEPAQEPVPAEGAKPAEVAESAEEAAPAEGAKPEDVSTPAEDTKPAESAQAAPADAPSDQEGASDDTTSGEDVQPAGDTKPGDA